MNSYFARLAEMSGVKIKAHGVDTKSTKVLIDGNDKYGGAQEQKEEEDKLASLFRMEEGSGFDIASASGSEKEEMPPSETFSQINMNHKGKTFNSSIDRREDTKLNNQSYLGETIKEDFISASNLSSATTKKSEEVDEITSSTGSSIGKRGNVQFIHNDDKDRLHDSDVRGNENPSTSSMPSLAKKMNLDENRQFKGYLEKLLDMPSIKSNIIRNENKASDDNSYQLHQPTHNNNLHGLPTHDSNAKKPTLKDDDISISIGTIILNVTKANNDSPRDQISVQKPESSLDNSSPSRLHRYYGRLR